MLFLYRPRQTWMPYRLPREKTQQRAYNREMQEKFDATHRVASPVPKDAGSEDQAIEKLKQLATLHTSGALTDEEFTLAKAKLLDIDAAPS